MGCVRACNPRPKALSPVGLLVPVCPLPGFHAPMRWLLTCADMMSFCTRSSRSSCQAQRLCVSVLLLLLACRVAAAAITTTAAASMPYPPTSLQNTTTLRFARRGPSACGNSSNLRPRARTTMCSRSRSAPRSGLRTHRSSSRVKCARRSRSHCRYQLASCWQMARGCGERCVASSRAI